MMIRLTAIAHPDLNGGQPYPVYLAPEHIVLIERSKVSQERYGWMEEHSRLTLEFGDEVQRAVGELRDTPSMTPETEEEARAVSRWVNRKEAAAALQAAYGLISQHAQDPRRYPPVEATCIQLAVPNARYTMLPCVYVVEPPDEVARLVGAASVEATYATPRR